MAKKTKYEQFLDKQNEGLDLLSEELFLVGNATGGADPAGCAYANGIISAARLLISSRAADRLASEFWDGARRSQERCYD